MTGVRVERLQEITEEDARAEGALVESERLSAQGVTLTDDFPSPRRAFRSHWRSINGAESWDANPWVWCVSFARIEAQQEAA